MSLTTITSGVTVTTTWDTTTSKQDVLTVSLRDIDPALLADEVEALVHRAVVRGVNDYNKETA